MLCWAAGNVIFVGWTQFQANPPIPSPADIAYFGFYFCVAAALVSLARRDSASLSRTLWLDGALGAAGAATALTVVLRSAFSGVGGSPGAVVVSLGYPLGDVLLLAMICGLLAVRGVRGGSMWWWLAVGLAIFVAADVSYVLQVQSASFAVGAVLSVAWTAGDHDDLPGDLAAANARVRSRQPLARGSLWWCRCWRPLPQSPRSWSSRSGPRPSSWRWRR